MLKADLNSIFCLTDYHYLDIFHFLIRGVQVNPFYSYPKRLSFKKSLNESTRIVYKEIGNNVRIILYSKNIPVSQKSDFKSGLSFSLFKQSIDISA